MPPEQALGARHDRRPGRTGQHSAGRRKDNAVQPLKPWSAGLPVQDLELMAEHQDLHVLRVGLGPRAD